LEVPKSAAGLELRFPTPSTPFRAGFTDKNKSVAKIDGIRTKASRG
jgi:hypothetical protein